MSGTCCDPWKHKWKEIYYGYECETCGQFVPFGCEPWLNETEEYISGFSDEVDE